MRLITLAVMIFGSLMLSCSTEVQYSGAVTNVVPELRNQYLSSVSLMTIEGRVFCSGTILRNEKGKSMVILTANHCVDGPTPVFISTAYDGVIRFVLTVKHDEEKDLAILRTMLAEERDGPFVQLAENPPKVGEHVTFIGNPSGETLVVTEGIISKWQTVEEVLYYRTNAELYYGNSGCGMFDDHGRLVGVADMLEQGFSRVIVVDENGVPHELGNVFSLYPKPGGALAVSLQEIKKFIRE